MTMSTNRKKLEWCDFEWFHHKKEIFMNGLTIRCRNSNGKSQKILFFFDNLKQHLTLDLSKKMFDVHMTSDMKGRPHENMISIPLRKINRKIRKNRNAFIKYIQFVSFSNSYFRRHFILIDPYSNKFHKQFADLSELGNIFPTRLWKLRVKHDDAIRRRQKHYFVYDLIGRRQGVVEVNIRRRQFVFCSEEPIRNISNELYNKGYIRNKLLEIGFTYNPKSDNMWKKWNSVIPIIEKILRIKSTIIN